METLPSPCFLPDLHVGQHGTWKFSRTGWAPGDIVRPWRIDLTPFVIPGRTAEFRYEPEPYDFSFTPEDKRPTPAAISRAVHLVRAYLVLYRTPTDLLEPPPLYVLGVVEDSNAVKAGIQTGDYLASYDGKQFKTISELRQAIQQAEDAGRESITVVVYRGREKIEKKIAPGQMGVLLEEQ